MATRPKICRPCSRLGFDPKSKQNSSSTSTISNGVEPENAVEANGRNILCIAKSSVEVDLVTGENTDDQKQTKGKQYTTRAGSWGEVQSALSCTFPVYITFWQRSAELFQSPATADCFIRNELSLLSSQQELEGQRAAPKCTIKSRMVVGEITGSLGSFLST